MTSPHFPATAIKSDSSSFKAALAQFSYKAASQSTRQTVKRKSTTRLPPSLSPLKKSRLSPSASKKPKRSSSGYAPPSKYSHIVNKLTDSIAPNLIVLFIGLNPGIRTATSGHAYSHPSNLFWKLLHQSGCTPRLCLPSEDGSMPSLYSLGLTNIVTRPTKDGSELSKQEMDDSVAELEDKIAHCRPEAVGIVGKSIWESIWRVRHGRTIRKEEFKYGWQDEGERMGRVRKTEEEGWEGARVFVLTTTSGLAASMKLHQKQAIWRVLGEWVKMRRGDDVVRREERGYGECQGEVIR